MNNERMQLSHPLLSKSTPLHSTTVLQHDVTANSKSRPRASSSPQPQPQPQPQPTHLRVTPDQLNLKAEKCHDFMKRRPSLAMHKCKVTTVLAQVLLAL
jgi:hypothetical protein